MTTPEQNRAKQAAFRQRQIDAGLIRLGVWVPAHMVEKIKDVVAEMVKSATLENRGDVG